MNAVKTTGFTPPELSIEELAQILLTLDESELDTLEILLDPQARITLEQSLEDLEKGRTIPVEEW
jgi:predicted transcriptional regulator